MPAIDFSSPILSLDGEPLKQSPTDKTPVVLRNLAVGALLATLLDSNRQAEQLTLEQKLANGELAREIFKATRPLTLKAEQIATLKDRIGRLYDTLPFMRAVEILDPR